MCLLINSVDCCLTKCGVKLLYIRCLDRQIIYFLRYFKKIKNLFYAHSMPLLLEVACCVGSTMNWTNTREREREAKEGNVVSARR